MKTNIIFYENQKRDIKLTKNEINAISSIPTAFSIKKNKLFKTFILEHYLFLETMYNELKVSNDIIISFEEFCNFIYDNSHN